ncbi:MAG: hypothetical protein PWP51_2974 [Clostridiales bacterium]|jgi:hypothetical protein|nr:hypothetical protein [Clostridiales bacterium]
MMAPGLLVNMKETIELSVDAVQTGRFFIKTSKHLNFSTFLI